MAHIQIGRADVVRLYQYCAAYGVHWFAAKNEQGAYVAAGHVTGFTAPRRYFDGCNPALHPEWKANADRMFGEGDFCEVLPRDWLRKVHNDETITRLQVNVNGEQLSCEFLRSPL